MLFYVMGQHELLIWHQLWIVQSTLAVTAFWLEVHDRWIF